MSDSRIFDRPVTNPDDDLLEMAVYSRTLAEFILKLKPPFTVGIYGEWGAGKSTFAGLLEHYLKDLGKTAGDDHARFIHFTAWPHKTSDELWRALVLEIARDLYREPSPPIPPAPTAPPAPRKGPGPWQRLHQWLAGDALALSPPPPKPDPLADYDSLVQQLDRTPGSIAKGSDQVRLNQDEALLAAVQAGLSALGTLSPLVAGFRGLFGLDSKINASELLQREKNEALRDRIQSIQEFRQLFRDIFARKAQGKCVCVFVDDLDRCMPDSALDLLEAIKIFLGEVPCVFVVAADENLIGQGLRLRFKELTGGRIDPDQDQTLFERKGQEYFEKIIQLGIRVPRPTPQQVHKFIAAQFPQWAPVSDILRVAVGDNPRRLKQYGNWLEYKRLVTGAQREAPREPAENAQTPSFDLALLDKIVTLHSWAPQCLDQVRLLAQNPTSWSAALAKIESCLAESQEDCPLPDIASRLPDHTEHGIYEKSVYSAPLFRLIQSEPRLSKAPAVVVETLARFADVAPHPRTVLCSRDVPFMRILKSLETSGTLTAERLLLDDFLRLVNVEHAAPSLLPLLGQVAANGEWTEQMSTLEAALEARATEPPNTLGPDALALFQQATAPPAPDDPDFRAILLQEPRFSALLREKIRAFLDLRRDRMQVSAESLLSPEIYANLSEINKQSRLAAHDRDHLPPDVREDILLRLRIRIDAAKHFLKLRTFAKLDALRHRWPKLAQLLWDDRLRLLAVERQILEPQPMPDELQVRDTSLLGDERLAEFLKLRPLLRDIYPDDLKQFLKMVQATEVQGQPLAAAQQPEPGSEAPALEVAAPVYENLVLSLRPRLDDPSPQEGRLSGYEVTLAYRDTATGQEQIQGNNVVFPWQEVDLMINGLHQFVRDATGLNQVRAVREAPARELRALEMREFGPFLQETGERLYEWTFPEKGGGGEVGDARELLLRRLQSGSNLRLLLDLGRPELSPLPWESLYLRHPLHNFLALSRKYSLVRYSPSPMPPIQRPLTPPLRVLVMLPQPTDAPPLNVEGEEAVIRRSLASAIDNKLVQLEVLSGRKATQEQLNRTMRVFRPHLFHFVGHGLFQEERNEGAIICESENGNAVLVQASTLASFLADNGVLLAVLNACDTGAAAVNDAVTGVAGTLVNAGIPAVIATMRPIPDEAALLFAREFYRAFVEGHSLEAAVAEARKILSAERWDWTVYALFSGLKDLSSFRLVTQPVRKS